MMILKNNSIKDILIKAMSIFVLLTVLGSHEVRGQELDKMSASVITNTAQANEYINSKKALSLKRILTILEEHYDVTFLYKGGLVNNKMVKNPDIQIGEKTGEQLSIIIDNLGLKLHRVNKTSYIVLPKPFEGKFEQQMQIVSGTVTDASTGESLPGVNVVLKGTSTGTSTNSEGQYELDVPSLQDTLMFSFIGYQTQEIPINGRTQIDVELQLISISGEKMVVTAYGTQARREVTGSISTVDAEQVGQVSESSLENALQGQVAGLQLTQGGGSSTSPSRITIRGINSISAGTEPLVVIDGMPVNGSHQSIGGLDQEINPLSMINPNDVSSIEVLKDASATAIYGSRGSNGVILITTKSGRQAGQFNVNYQTGLSQPVNKYNFVNTQKWLEIADVARANNPNNLDPFNPETDFTFGSGKPELSRNEIEKINTDWFDKIVRSGNFHDVNISASGQNQSGANYFVSANYRTNEGYLAENRTDRIVGRVNVDFNPLENLDAGVRTNFTFFDQDQVPDQVGGPPSGNDQIANGNWNAAVSGALPWLPIRDDSGQFFDITSGNNLVATLNENWYTARSNNIRTLGKIYMDYKIPSFNQLEIHAEVSGDYNINSSLRSATSDIRPSDNPYGRDVKTENWSLNFNAFGTYVESFGGVHNVKITTGIETFQSNGRFSFIEVLNRTATDEMIGSPSGDSVQRLVFDRGEETRFIGLFSRVNYNYKKRYIAQFSVRRDGSSVFGRNESFGLFPAGSAGWIISDESFMENFNFLSFLKLRGSYGVTGNANIPVGVTENQFQGWKRFGSVPQGFFNNQIGNQDVGWETTKSTDVGIEYGLFNDRISGKLTYFKQNVNDMLLASPIAQSNGTQSESIWANIGTLNNSGFEFQVNTTNIQKSKFSWTSNFNLTFTDGDVESLTPILSSNNSGLVQGLTNTRIGNNIGSFFIAKSAGINPDTGYEMIYEVDNNPFLINQNGDFIDQNGSIINEKNKVENPNYLKETGDIIPATESNVANNRMLLEDKTGVPTYFGGFTNSISYKSLSLSLVFNFQGGNYIYNNVLRNSTRVQGARNFSTDLLSNSWTVNNQNAKYPKLSWNNQHVVNGEVKNFSSLTSMYLSKGNFIRLRRVKIGYDLSQSFLRNTNMSGIELYFMGTNLWTHAPNFSGLDPEVTSFGNAQERNLNPGVLNSSFLPVTRQFSLGINLNF